VWEIFSRLLTSYFILSIRIWLFFFGCGVLECFFFVKFFAGLLRDFWMTRGWFVLETCAILRFICYLLSAYLIHYNSSKYHKKSMKLCRRFGSFMDSSSELNLLFSRVNLALKRIPYMIRNVGIISLFSCDTLKNYSVSNKHLYWDEKCP
jgi:hypothetical protein